MSNVIPRRIRLDRMTPAELAITNAMATVEEAGAHVLLTDAVILLEQARDKVADFVDKQGISLHSRCTDGFDIMDDISEQEQ